MATSAYLDYAFLDDLIGGPPSEPSTLVDHVWAIVKDLPREFSLGDLYRNASRLAERFPGNQEIEASIRAALQTLRDSGYVEFLDNRGHYRRLK